MPVNKLSELKRGASAAPEDIVIDIEGIYPGRHCECMTTE